MSRWVLGVFALVIGFGIGWAVFRPKPTAAAGSQLVYVYQPGDDENKDPDVDPEETTISTDDYVFWVQRGAKKKDVHIEFDKEVFDGMTAGGHGWSISNCHGRNCVSGPTKGDKGRFKYFQIVHDPGNPSGKRKEKDGWIIIR